MFGALSVGTRAIAASQLAIDVTGQNISNANTEGYSRKRVSVSADSVRSDQFGQIGSGVDIKSVERVRSEFLDRQINDRMAEKGYYEEKDNILENIENVFTEPSDSSLNNYMDDFWNSWQDLANNPADLATREAVASTTNVMIGQFHALSTELQAMRNNMDTQIASEVDMVNGLAKRILLLNQEISNTELSNGKNANDSRDERDQLMKDLSSHIKIDSVEDDSGRIQVTANGILLVSATDTVPLELTRSSFTEADGSITSKVGIAFGNTHSPYVPADGSIKSLIDNRDEIIPSYEDQLNTMAESLVNAVNGLHETGYNLAKETGISFFDPTKTLASNISLSAAVQGSVNSISASSGGVQQAPAGGPITMALDATYPVDTEIDLTTANPQYRDLVQGTLLVKDAATGAVLEEGPGKDYVVDYQNGSLSFVNTARFSAGDNIEIDFRYNDNEYAGPGDGSNAMAISQLREAQLTVPDKDGNNTQTIGEYYGSLVGGLGIERNEANSTLETKKFILQQLDNRQQEIAGVSLDEEMANMIRYEHTYQSAARYISTVNTLMDTLLQM